MPNLRLYLLGSPRIELDGSPVDVDTRKALALLAYLVVSETEQRRDTLAALLWPDYDHAHALGALRRTLSALRKALGEASLEITRESVIILPQAPFWSDYAEFHACLAESKNHGHTPQEVCPDCIPPLVKAAGLYRDHFMAGFSLCDSAEFDDWQFFQSEALRREFSGVLERLVQSFTGQGNFAEAVLYAQRWLALDPLHEPAHRQLMRLFAWSGQRNAALRQFHECEKILAKELQVEPLEETVALYRAVKENRLPAPRLRPPDAAISRLTTHSDRPVLAPADKPSGAGAGQPFPAAGSFPMVGRTQEWGALEAAYAEVSRDGFFFILQGEPGIGKTRLAEEFLDSLRSRGAAILSTRSYPGESSLAYGPFVEILRGAVEAAGNHPWPERVAVQWLSEAGRLLPDLQQIRAGIPPAPSLDTPGAQTRFFEGLSQVLSAVCDTRPVGAIFFDDLHWADEASIDLLTYLVRRMRGRPVLLLASWRGEDVPPQHRLRRLLAEAQRDGRAALLSLAPLSPGSVEMLVRSVLPVERAPTQALSRRLHRETDGLPFFVVEYLKGIASGTVRGSDQDWFMPGSVRDLLHSRLVATTETGWQLLQTAATIGRSFDFDTLREASGRSDDETLEALEALIQRGLVREVAGGQVDPPAEAFHSPTYDFSHEKIRALVYEETSVARRKILHRRVAEALAARAHIRREGENLAGVIARHYHLAGQLADAARSYRQAGEHARSLYANAEALVHYQAALELGHSQPAELHEAIGDLQTLSGDYSGARSSYESSVNQSGFDPHSIARLDQKLGNLYDRHGEWDLAEKYFQLALDCLDTEGQADDAARIYADWSLTVHHRGQTDRAQSLARRALELAQAAGDPLAMAQAYNMVGVLARSQADFTLARSSLEQSLALAESQGDPGVRAAALNNLALVFGSQGDLAQAVQLTESALTLCIVQGDRHREAALHNNLADLLHLQGQSEAAMSHLKTAVAIFAEIGAADSTGKNGFWPEGYQPEIWKLSEW